jgi:hypothetical protein
MNSIAIPLTQIEIASPCDASWEDMSGDDRTRFCHHCHKNVYNLSALSGDAARALLQARGEDLCIRFFQR